MFLDKGEEIHTQISTYREDFGKYRLESDMLE